MIRTRTVLQHVFLAFAACLVFSCSQIADAPEIPALRDTSRAHLVLSVSDASQPDATQNPARDIVPGSGTALLTDLQLTGTFDGDDASQTLASAESLDALSEQDIELKPGDWSLTLSAKLGGVTYTGTCTAKLSVGENTVTFTLSPVVGTHYGGFSLEMAYTGGVTKVLAKVTASDSTTEICAQEELTPTSTGTQAGKVTYAKSMDAADEKIEAGLYRVVIEFYGGDTAKTADGNLLLLNTYREFVRIAAGRTSTATRTIDLNEVYTITYYDVAADGTATEIDGTTVTFDANAPAQFSRKSSAITLPAVTKAGYTFAGWYTDAACTAGNEITAVSKGTGHDVKAYAKWLMIPYAKVNGVAYGNLSATVTAITNATGDIEVSLFGTVTKDDIGRYYTAGTLAYAVKNTHAESVLLDMSGAEAVTELNAEVFRNCDKVVSAVLPPNLTVVPEQAFSGCAVLKTVTIPASVTKIDTYAFYETDLTSASFLKDESDTTEYRWKWSTYYFNPKNTSASVEALKTAEGNVCKKVALSSIPFGVKTGSEINSILTALGAKPSGKATAFRPSETEPAGDVSYYLDPALDAIPVWASADGKTIYYYCKDYTDGEKKKLPLNADSSHMFQSCSSLVSIDVSGFDTSGVENMFHMFDGCSALTALDVSGFDTKNVDNMMFLFSDCSALTSLDLSSLNTANVTAMTKMFSGCSSLETLNVSGFNTEKVEFMAYMFFGCLNLESLDVSGFDTACVTSMGCMFEDCSNLKTLDVSGFDTSNVTDMGSMFHGCLNLESLDVSGFVTTSVTNIGSMFRDCSKLETLDISGFNTSLVTLMDNVFNGCSALKTVYASDSFVTTSVTNDENMFAGCASLVGGAGTAYDSTKTDATYAHIDGGTTNPGYFTGVQAAVELSVTIILPDYAQIPVTKTEDAENVTFTLNDTTGAWKNCIWIFDGTEYTEQTQFVLEKASLAKGSYDLTLEATYHNSTTGKDEPYSYFVQIRVE